MCFRPSQVEEAQSQATGKQNGIEEKKLLNATSDIASEKKKGIMDCASSPVYILFLLIGINEHNNTMKVSAAVVQGKPFFKVATRLRKIIVWVSNQILKIVYH